MQASRKTSGAPATAVSTINNWVNNSTDAAPKANTFVDATISNGQLKVVTKTKFFSNVDGNVRIAVYVLENNIIAPQTSSNDNTHNNVMRKALTSVTGDLLENGPTANSVKEMTFSTNIDQAWKSQDLYVVTALYMPGASQKPLLLNVAEHNIKR